MRKCDRFDHLLIFPSWDACDHFPSQPSDARVRPADTRVQPLVACLNILHCRDEIRL